MSDNDSAGRPPDAPEDTGDDPFAAGVESLSLDEAAHGIFDYAERVQGELGGDDEESAEASEPWVSFEVAGRRYALPVDDVKEVLRVGTITRVPHSPDAIGGVTNMRGRVLPVVDLRRRLGFDPKPAGGASRILVAVSTRGPVGLLVDAVEQMVPVPPSAHRDLPLELREEEQGAAVAVVDAEDPPLLLLDLERLLAPIASAASG